MMQEDNDQRKLRILVFNHPNILSSIVKALSQFSIVSKVNWEHRPIEDSALHFCLKIPYRTMEGFYWVLRLMREIHRFQADVIVTQYVHFCGLIGAVASKLSRKEFVVQTMGSDLKIDYQSIIGKALVLLTFRMSSGVICVSKDLENIAKRIGAKSTKMIPDALDFPSYSETSVCKKDKLVITVARLVPIKGISYLIQAIAPLKDCTLVVIGDGPERRKLESLSENLGLSNRVLFTGWISNRSRLVDHLKEATVFVLPSLSEGIPRAVIEAMACGLPIIATNVGGIPEIVAEGVNGLLVPPRNEKALAEAIEKALGNTDFLRNASVENRKVAKRFLLPLIGLRTHNYLKNIAASHR